MNVGLILPLFYEYSRRVRQGVLSWMDENPGWRLVEMDPQQNPFGPELATHFTGVISWVIRDKDGLSVHPDHGIPAIDCGSGEGLAGTPDPVARVTFDRNSIGDLAIQHFHDLGVEVVGYVGSRLRADGARVERVAALRSRALEAGMEWIEHDLGPLSLSQQLEWLWRGTEMPGLVAFLKECPKPVGLLAEDDYFGVLICETALKLGLKIPKDIVVLGQGDRVLGRSGNITLSSVVIPGYEVGRMAAGMLDRWMRTSTKPDPALRAIPCKELIIRESSGGLSRDLGIERAKRYLELNAMKGATVGELAAIAGCSSKTLRSRFQQIYGINVAETLRNLRSTSALKLLAESSLEIQEVGRMCGFTSAPNFFNFVKRQSGGLGPAEYRTAHRGPRAGTLPEK